MPKDETAFVMQEIRHLVRTKGYRYRDIAIIAGNIATAEGARALFDAG